MTNPILNNALAMAAVMTGGEIFAYLQEYCENVFMNVLTMVGDLLWTLIRAAILIAIWAIFMLVTCFLTLAIAALAVPLFALALIFNAEMYYTINSVGIDFGEFSFSTGYCIYFEYSNFINFTILFLYVYFFLGEIKLIGLVIKFWPPKISFMAEDETIQNALPESSILENSEIEGLASSSIDDDPILNCIRAFIVGMDSSFGLWSTSIVIISLSFMTPPQYEQIKWGIQIIAFSVNLGFLIMDMLHYLDIVIRGKDWNPLYRDYEAFWYLIGSGFITILTGIKLFEAGKTKNLTFADAACSQATFNFLFQNFNGNSFIKEFLSDIFMALLPSLPAALKYWFYDEKDIEWPEDFQNEFEAKFFALEIMSVLLSAKDWHESIIFLECMSVLCSTNTYTKGNFDKDIKQIGGLTIIVGAIQILLAFSILLNI